MTIKKPTTVQFGGLELSLQLSGRNVINIEGRLKESMIGMFLSAEGGMQLPPANKLLIVLQGANNVHGVTDEKIADAFEKFLDEGHTTMDLMKIVQDLLDESGFLGKNMEPKKDEKAGSGRKVVTLDAPEAVAESPLD
ncbi:DUF6096 family protein [Lacticaseibacillus yichunensis]|uniref:DUF6096 family protein n=1 Tax=Lacticaseibacillus yichunensis TaxID=2486015 RepID=A0ABW4CL29_9LACO|nr:DUF6096 family protein [Lacticaseibacillus yichunensis]